MNLLESWRTTKREIQLQVMALFFILFNKSYLHSVIRYDLFNYIIINIFYIHLILPYTRLIWRYIHLIT